MSGRGRCPVPGWRRCCLRSGWRGDGIEIGGIRCCGGGKNVAGKVCRLCLPAREIKVVVCTAHVGEFRFRHS